MPTQGDNSGIVAADHAHALPHADSGWRDVTAKSPREVFDAAMASPDMTREDFALHRSRVAAVRAADEAKLAAPSPQAALDLDLAA